jgi:hypothetical protein
MGLRKSFHAAATTIVDFGWISTIKFFPDISARILLRGDVPVATHVDQVTELMSDALSGTPSWESKPDDETGAVVAIASGIEARVRAAAASAPARRDAHPKAHGCVAAEFRVLDNLLPSYRVGVFEQPRSYPAWIRFSNGSETPQNDSIGDGRGMAVKVMDVAGSRSGTQDFIMINSPAFFVRNAADYVAFQAAADNPLRFFFPGWNPFEFRLHELLAAWAIKRRTVSNPLNVRYWSMTPYLFGDIPCKFSCRPVAPASSFNDRTTPNFLRDNLVKSLRQRDAAFDICVQLRTKPDSMPVEDPTIEWQETDSPFVRVARITIPQQVFDTPERMAFGENLSFTPWHGLDAHRPLGGINRVRRTVYEAISRLRHEINHVPRIEPTGSPAPAPPRP